jgi:predicted phage tail protein
MVNVKLHGIFEQFIKTEWDLNVKTIGEALEAIEANSGKLIIALNELQEYLSHFIIYVDNKIVSSEYLYSPILKKNSHIEVVPLLMGSDFGLSLILLAVSIGIQFMITKLLSPKNPVDIKSNSKLFSSYENVTKRNFPVPLGYGRIKTGSIVISNDVDVVNIGG